MSLSLGSESFWKKRNPLFLWLNYFLSGNILLFWLIGLRYIFAITPLALGRPSLFNEILAWAFLSMAFIGQIALLIWLPIILIGTFLIFSFPHRTILFTCITLVATFLVTLLFIDTHVFAQFRFHLNGIILSLVFSGQFKEVFDISRLEWLSISCFLLATLLFEVIFGIYCWKCHFSSFNKYLRNFCGVCLMLSAFMYGFGWIHPALSINKQAYALPFYDNVFSLLLPAQNSFWKEVMMGEGNFAQLRQSNLPLRYPLQPLICKPAKKPLNLLIIIIDTWRFDMLTNSVTPQVFQLAQQSWQFTNHYSGGNATQPGIFSLFYGLPDNYWTAMTEQQRGPILIHILLAQHYHPGIFASAELLAPAFNLNVFREISHLQTTTPGATSFQRDKVITQDFLHFIKHTPQPFFGMLFYDSAHSYCKSGNSFSKFQPAIAACNRISLTNDTNPAPYLNRYKNALYFVDHEIGQVLAKLKQQGLLKNTVVVVTGDHGNEFNDNHLGYWEHASNFTNYQTQTPLIIYWPGHKPAIFRQFTSHYDIVPTLMQQLLGCQNPSHEYSLGGPLPNDTALKYLIVNSYVNFGIIEPDRITTFSPTGNYNITDRHGRPIPNAQARVSVITRALQDMNRFYQTYER